MSTYDALATLPLTVDGYGLEGLRADVSSGFERLTTVVRLRGEGVDGIGEDVVYSADDQRAFQAAGETGALPDLSGTWSLGDFCDRVDGLDLFAGAEPEHGEVSRLYRRWTFHSAALDLALRQAGRPLSAALGRETAPVTFVVSLRLGEPATLAPLHRRLAAYPTLRFKLDATASWTDEIVAGLAQSGAVDSVDFKAHYHGTVVDTTPDGALYRRVVAAFPDAWLEDPDVVSDDTAAALADVHDRITWDAPIHGIEDIEALPFRPRMVNLKPSRLGGLRRLCAAYDYCAAHGIGAYGGGQFELGPGRGQAQYLASLFHPDTPNDLAPVGYNEAQPVDGLASSPLDPAPDAVGFRSGGAVMSRRLEGTVALVTGASSGIGEATALALAAEGATVALTARRRDRLQTLAERIGSAGGRALALEADITADGAARTLVEHTVAELGRLDTLVNNAGVMLLGPALDAPVAEWERMMTLNVQALLWCAHAALPHLLAAAQSSPRGVADMVNVSSTAGRQVKLGSGVYNLTKHGVGAFSESLRMEVTRRHLRVSLIEPGATDTELRDHLRPEIRERQQERMASMQSLAAADVAESIAFIVTRPRHVAINELLIRPTEQAD